MSQSAVAHEKLQKAKRYLRYFLSDTPELNLLLRDYETPDDKLEFCIEMALSDWNSTAPILMPPTTILNYPSLYLLMHGSAIIALKSAGLFQTRNALQYQSGGSAFQRFGKESAYMSWIQLFSNDYEQKKQMLKVSENIERGWHPGGGVASEYYKLRFW